MLVVLDASDGAGDGARLDVPADEPLRGGGGGIACARGDLAGVESQDDFAASTVFAISLQLGWSQSLFAEPGGCQPRRHRRTSRAGGHGTGPSLSLEYCVPRMYFGGACDEADAAPLAGDMGRFFAFALPPRLAFVSGPPSRARRQSCLASVR